MKTNSVPKWRDKERFDPHRIADRLSTVSTTSSKAAWIADGTSEKWRVAKMPLRTRTNMIIQVVTTPAVIGTGPNGKRDATERRGHGAASRTLFITTKRAMSTPSAL